MVRFSRFFVAAAIAATVIATGRPVVVGAAAAPASENDATLQHIRELLRSSPLIDGHNDLPWEVRDLFKSHLVQVDLESDTGKLDHPLQTDLVRLRAGGVGGQFWSVWVPTSLSGPEALRTVIEQIDLVKRMTARYSKSLELAFTAVDVRRIHASGKIASLIGMEGGHSIGDSLAALRQLYALGARYMTLTHWDDTDWADASTAKPEHNGLTPFGKEVVREMNRLGMIVDLSHTSAKTMRDALEVSQAPAIFSHSGAFGLCGHPRNVPDDVLTALAANGGVVMVDFVPGFVSEEVRQARALADGEDARLKSLYPGDPAKVKELIDAYRKAHPMPRATLAQVADHIEYVRKVAGIDHVGIGSDFDGMGQPPAGLDDVSRYPYLLAELARRGWSDDAIRKVAGLNVLRVFEAVETTARRLQSERGPSELRFEESDAKDAAAANPKSANK